MFNFIEHQKALLGCSKAAYNPRAVLCEQDGRIITPRTVCLLLSISTKAIFSPKPGQRGSVGLVITKTLVILGDPRVTTTDEHPRGAMLRAYDKKTSEEVGGGPYSCEYLAFGLPSDVLEETTSGGDQD